MTMRSDPRSPPGAGAALPAPCWAWQGRRAARCSGARLSSCPMGAGDAALPASTHPLHPVARHTYLPRTRECANVSARTHARPLGTHTCPRTHWGTGVSAAALCPPYPQRTQVSPLHVPTTPPPGIAACRPHTACSDHPHCRPIPPTRHAALALGTLSPSSLDGSGALSPLLPQAVFVTASLMPHSHAILPCSPTRCPRGRAKVTQATMKLMVPALKCLA